MADDFFRPLLRKPLLRDQRNHRLAALPEAVHQARFDLTRKCQAVELVDRVVVARGFTTERSLTIDTTAAGGNASLLSLEEELPA